MKRRIFAMVLACAMALSLAACGGNKDNTSASNPGSSSSADGSGASSSQPDGSVSQGDISESASVTLNENSVTLNKAGASFQLQHFTGPEPNQLPTFSSSDEAVATVDGKGTITAVAPGTATITATAQDGSGRVLTGECVFVVEILPATAVGAVLRLGDGPQAIGTLKDLAEEKTLVEQLTKGGDDLDSAPAIDGLMDQRRQEGTEEDGEEEQG